MPKNCTFRANLRTVERILGTTAPAGAPTRPPCTLGPEHEGDHDVVDWRGRHVAVPRQDGPGRPAERVHTEPLSVRVPEALAARLDAWAARKRLPRAEALRRFLDEHLPQL